MRRILSIQLCLTNLLERIFWNTMCSSSISRALTAGRPRSAANICAISRRCALYLQETASYNVGWKYYLFWTREGVIFISKILNKITQNAICICECLGISLIFLDIWGVHIFMRISHRYVFCIYKKSGPTLLEMLFVLCILFA